MAGEERPIGRRNEAVSPIVSQREWVETPLATGRSETAAESAARTGIPDGAYLALAAGERLELCDGLTLAHHARQAIFVGCGEMVIQDRVHHHRTWHFQLPGQESDPGKPTVNSVVATFIHKKPIGWRSLGTHFLCFLAADGSLLERVDNSMDYGTNSAGTWEFNYDELGVLCRSVGISFRIERYEMASEFIAAHPEWTPPELEFETDHLPTERVREWGLAFAIGLPIAIGGLGVVGGFFLLIGPIGWFVKGLGILGIVVAVTLTIWGHSKWRMKRSLRQHTHASDPAAKGSAA